MTDLSSPGAYPDPTFLFNLITANIICPVTQYYIKFRCTAYVSWLDIYITYKVISSPTEFSTQLKPYIVIAMVLAISPMLYIGAVVGNTCTHPRRVGKF